MIQKYYTERTGVIVHHERFIKISLSSTIKNTEKQTKKIIKTTARRLKNMNLDRKGEV